jgi:stalled ribosome rescue protein Dom34
MRLHVDSLTSNSPECRHTDCTGHHTHPAGSSIRLKGRNLTESEHVKLGAYHTLELEPGRSFMLHKALWDGLDIERIRTATDPQASADLAALLITVRQLRRGGGD